MLWSKAVAPRLDEESLRRRLEEVRKSLPVPVFWLLGKAQSGKTSLVRALTGSSRAEIGNGFRPCTRTAQLYAFPNEEEAFLKFLDTRGLGEAAVSEADLLEAVEAQAHLLVVVMKAMDHAQQPVLEAYRQITRRHPNWPVVVLQTALHEGYPSPATRHALPYPYGQDPLPASVPADVARSLALQRKLFPPGKVRFVPVDFTLPEDRYEPEHYGLDALWNAVEDVLPLGLRAMLEDSAAARLALRDPHFRAAHPHIIFYALAAGGAGVVPLPVIDIPLVLAIQAKLFHTVASIYGQKMNRQWMAEISSSLGMGTASRLGLRELLKLIPVPGLGPSVSALYAGASTYALGRALCVYFEHVRGGTMPDPAALRAMYQEQYARGRAQLAQYLQQLTRK